MPVVTQIETLTVPARLVSIAPLLTQRHLKTHLIVGVSKFAASLSTTNRDFLDRRGVKDETALESGFQQGADCLGVSKAELGKVRSAILQMITGRTGSGHTSLSRTRRVLR